MGLMGFCKILRSCGFCENLRFPVVFCENPHRRSAVIPAKKRKSAKVSENLRKTATLAPFVPFNLSLSVPPEGGCQTSPELLETPQTPRISPNFPGSSSATSPELSHYGL